MRQSILKIKAQILSRFSSLALFVYFLSTVICLNALARNNSEAEDAKVISESTIPIVAGTRQDQEKKLIEFTMVNPQKPEEKIHGQFQFDPREKTEISVMRNKMEWQVKELVRQIEFTRVFLGLPTEMDPRAVFEKYYYLPQTVRDEIHRQYDLKTKSTKTIAKEAFMRPFSGSLHGFGAQSILFTGAIGAVMYWQLLTDYAADPLSMVRHLESLTDPIAHMAFYSFMAANGFTSDMLLKKYAGVPGTAFKSRMTPNGVVSTSTMRIAIPYLGMSAGMMASSLTVEVLNLMKTCVSALIKPPTQMDTILKSLGQPDPCDVAQNEFFNFNNKVEQYIPMMLSMAVASGTLTFAQKGYQNGKLALAGSNAGKKIAGTKVFETVAKLSRPTLQFIGLKLAARVTPTGWFFNSITVGAALVSTLQNAGFIGLDHSLNPVVSKIWAQFWRAGSVDEVDLKLLEYYNLNQKNSWNLDANYTASTKMHKGRSAVHHYNIIPLLKTFQEQMDAWRMINHSKYFNGIQIWTSMTSEIIRELQATENFYTAFIEEIFNAFKSQQIIKTEGKIEDARKWQATYLPFRTFPLYGIMPTGHASCEIDPDNCKTEAELNWFSPDQMVQFQKETIKRIIPQFEEAVALFEKKLAENQRPSISKESQNKIQEIIQKIKTTDDEFKIGIVIGEINRILSDKDLKDSDLQLLLTILRNNLGNPTPIMTPGLAVPYLYSSLFPQYFEKLSVPKSRNGFTFTTYPEYLLYQMMCGPDSQDSELVLRQSLGFKPKFKAPRIIAHNYQIRMQMPRYYTETHKKSGALSGEDVAPLFFLCKNLIDQNIKFEIAFGQLFQSKVFVDNKSEGELFISFFSTQILPSILGDWTDTRAESTSAVDKWWLKSIKPVFTKLFIRLDHEFQSLLHEMIEGMNSEKLMDGLFDTVVDPNGKLKRTQAGRGLFKASNQELQTYLTLLGEMETLKNHQTDKKSTIKLHKGFTFIELMNTDLYARTDSQKEFVQAFKPLYQALKNMKPTQGKVVLSFAPGEFSQYQNQVQKALKVYGEYLNSLNLSPYHQEIAGFSFQGLQKISSQMTAYLINTQLTNFSTSESYQKLLADNELNGSENESTKPLRKGANPRGQ